MRKTPACGAHGHGSRRLLAAGHHDLIESGVNSTPYLCSSNTARAPANLCDPGGCQGGDGSFISQAGQRLKKLLEVGFDRMAITASTSLPAAITRRDRRGGDPEFGAANESCCRTWFLCPNLALEQ